MRSSSSLSIIGQHQLSPLLNLAFCRTIAAALGPEETLIWTPLGNLEVIFEDMWVLGVASVQLVRPTASHQTHMSAEIRTVRQCVRVLWGKA